MIGFIIWIIGLILAIKAVLEIMKWKVDGVKKLLVYNRQNEMRAV